MTKRIYLLYLLLLSLTLSKNLTAQQYPVDCRILLSPPYSSNLGDYANSPMKFRVQLLLRDLSKPSLEVSLRIRLKGAGVWIENPADFISTQSIVLTPGVPKLLSGLELGENFASQNLEAQGIDVNELYAGAPLPVGPYEWEVYAVELYRNRQVSNIGNARMSINYNYPPLLNTPQGLQMASQPQNLRFSWTPRHTASPTAAAGVVYTLFLYEIPEGEDPQMIVNSGLAPYRIIETTQPYYNYDVSEIPLNIGKQYAWVVHVTDFEGKDTFVNNGYSEIKTFQYGKAKCGVPTNLISKIEADGAVKLSWDNNLDAQSYILSYQASDGPIQVEEILSNEHYLLNQEKGKSYIWQVNCNCGIGNTSAIAKNNFSIPADNVTSWLSDPDLTYEGDSYPAEPETEPSTAPTETVDDTATIDNTTIEESPGDEPASIDIDALLNTPVQIIIPAEGQETLPANVPSSIPALPADASIEQLQAALKTKKPLCSGVNASFSCGNHDALPQYSGSLVSIGPGDEIAMNTMVLSVVSIDGSGNGDGLIKVPMMGNIKVGVKLSGIQVAEGGCIVGGRAELSGVAVSLLSDKQKVELTKAYNVVNTITKTAIDNAGAIAETINSLGALVEKIKTDVSNYVGGLQDAKKMKVNFAAAEIFAAELLKSKNLSDSTRAQLQAALQDALATKDFFCSGEDCAEIRNATKKGGPYFEDFEDPKPKCEKNKATLNKLNTTLKKAGDEVQVIVKNIYDFANEIAIGYGKFVEASSTPNKLSKNFCGEYLMFSKTVPSLSGTDLVSYLSPPIGKKAISSYFKNEVEYFQYLVLRVLYSDKIGCRNFSVGSDIYLDEEFFKKRQIVLEFFALKYKPFDIPIWKQTGVNDQTSLEVFKENVLMNFFNPLKNQTVQLEWLKFGHNKIVYSNYGELLGAISTLGINLTPEISLSISSLKNGFSVLVRKFAIKCPGLLKLVNGAGRFIANSGTELKTFLNSIVTKPVGVTYKGDFIKSIGKKFHPDPKPKLLDDYATTTLDHRYSKVGESGYYASETDAGNIIEMGFNNGTVKTDFNRFLFENVEIDNMLDLTDDVVRANLGVTEAMIKKLGTDKYVFTSELATWSRTRYKGIIYPGANPNGIYKNIVLFHQVDIDMALKAITPKIIP